MDYGYGENGEENISGKSFLDDSEEAQKNAARERRRRKQYKFSDKAPSIPGIISSILALSALIFLAGAILISVLAGGNGRLVVGVFCAVSFIETIAGFILAVIAFRNTGALLKYAWIGLISNALIWLICGGIIAMGM